MKKIISFVFALSMSFILLTNLAHAIEPYTPLTDLPFWKTDSNGAVINPSNIIPVIYVASIGIGSILAVIMITISGIQYMISEAVTVKGDAKKRVWAALGGLLLLLSSYLILKTINPRLTTSSLSVDSITNPADTSGFGTQTGVITPPITETGLPGSGYEAGP